MSEKQKPPSGNQPPKPDQSGHRATVTHVRATKDAHQAQRDQRIRQGGKK
jgi:hypothetical protein